MKIALIRHGETDWNKLGKLQGRDDIPLNEAGIDQVRAAAVYFSKSTWDEIISSPLSRAKKSAEIIAERAGLKTIHEDVDFIERDMGEVSGMTMEARRAAFPEGKFNGMEPIDKLQDRIRSAVLRYVDRFAGKNIIVVSHGAAINSFLSYLSHGEIGTGKTLLNNACISLLEYDAGEFTIVFFNKEAKELG
jgi:uncharacterized phosphatase